MGYGVRRVEERRKIRARKYTEEEVIFLRGRGAWENFDGRRGRKKKEKKNNSRQRKTSTQTESSLPPPRGQVPRWGGLDKEVA